MTILHGHLSWLSQTFFWLLQSPEMLLSLKGAEASAVDIDDRRYVFQINHAMLKRYVFIFLKVAVFNLATYAALLRHCTWSVGWRDEK